MKTLIALFIILISSVCSLQAQNGWKDMRTYKETTDTTGQISQMKITPDGKYVYCLTTLTEQKKNNLYLQKWSIDSGTIVFSRFIDPTMYTKIYGINLNCDAATYSVCATLLTNPSEYRLMVKDNETDSLLVSVVDQSSDSKGFVQMDYDSVFKCFYFAKNSIYSTQNGSEYTSYSTGSVIKKVISGDTLIQKSIASPNTDKFTHILGTNFIGVISNNLYEHVKNNIGTTINSNRINFSGFQSEKCFTLKEYKIDSHAPYPPNQITLSPNGHFVSTTDANTFTTWYIDSTLISDELQIYPIYTNCLTFHTNKYLLVNSPKDSTIYTVNIGLRKICGSYKEPIAKKINLMLGLKDTNSIIAACSDGKFRMINVLLDTLKPTYSFRSGNSKIFQYNSVAFCAVIPSFDKSTILWNFGDSVTSSSFNPRHTFNNPGIFDVTMKVTDEFGEHIITKQQLVEVTAFPNPITLDFDVDVKFGTPPLTVKFTNKSTGTIKSYKWSFGDGTFSSARDTTHIFYQQRSYTITLTVNNGIKDTSITRIHYINADNYPSFLLNSKLVQSIKGTSYYYNRYTETFTNIFDNLVRSKTGNVYVRQTNYHNSDLTVPSMDRPNYCNVDVKLYRLNQEGKFDKEIARFDGKPSQVGANICSEENGTVGLLHDDLLSYFVSFDNYKYQNTYLLNGDSNKLRLQLPYSTMFYNVNSLSNNIDCYSFRKERNKIQDVSNLCFYKDTTKLLNKEVIDGYALPAIETNDNRFLSVVTLNKNKPQIQYRWYDTTGFITDSTYIDRTQNDVIYHIVQLENSNYLLCGSTIVGDSIAGYKTIGLILIIAKNGTVLFSRELPQWSSFLNITPMDRFTYAITGTPKDEYPGFIAVQYNGNIIGDFRGNITKGIPNLNHYAAIKPEGSNVAFGKTMKTVFFTRNDGYDAELYVSDNPFLKDINVSVKEESREQIPSTNSIYFAPNPTDGVTSVQYNSTNQQTITITVVSVVGQVLMKQEVQVSAGRNDIPLDVSRFGSGVVFVNISDSTALYHGQLHIIR